MADAWLAFNGQTKHITAQVTFKPVSEDDMGFLSDLYRSTRWQEVLQAPWSDQQRKDFLQQQFLAQHEHYLKHYPKAEKLVIKLNDEAIGRIYLDRDDVSICLIDVSLLSNHRGNGLGTQLLKELIDEAQLTKKKIVIHVENFNPAYQWYVRHGFKQMEDKGVYQYLEWHPKPSE
jgi:RimJ/RimL family protein N-acetyltransferase